MKRLLMAGVVLAMTTGLGAYAQSVPQSFRQPEAAVADVPAAKATKAKDDSNWFISLRDESCVPLKAIANKDGQMNTDWDRIQDIRYGDSNLSHGIETPPQFLAAFFPDAKIQEDADNAPDNEILRYSVAEKGHHYRPIFYKGYVNCRDNTTD